jgi:hypothetical protein
MNYYADSSFLVSCYLLDANTARAKSYLSALNMPLVSTPLHGFEVRNAFELGVFRGLLTHTDTNAAWANLQNDLKNSRLIQMTVKWPPAFRRAARLSELHSATTGTRSLDILHVAAAKSLRSVEFISFDLRQRALAIAAGLKVTP